LLSLSLSLTLTCFELSSCILQCVHPIFKMGGYTLVETRFNLYSVEISVRPQHILLNLSPLSIIVIQSSSKCKELSEGIDKLLYIYFIIISCLPGLKCQLMIFSDYFSLTILLASNSSAKRAVTISGPSSQIFSKKCSTRLSR
jgi:hypothetical protein